MIQGRVSNIQDFSINDGRGIRTTVFLSSCPLRCKWCANPETIYTPGDVMSADDVMKRISRSSIFFRNSQGGVTFSGGEPTMQAEFLYELVSRCQSYGYHTAIETCGYFDMDSLKHVFQKLDFIFVDLKHMDRNSHLEGTAKHNDVIFENIKLLGAMDKEIVVRIPLIGSYNDSNENIIATGNFVREHLPNPKIEILPYHFYSKDKYRNLQLPYPAQEFHIPTPERIAEIKNILSNLEIEIVSFA